MQELAPVYVWQPAGKDISIHLNLDLVARLGAAVAKSAAARDRGAEIGGLLLGVAQPGPPRITAIEDFEPLPCEHARGPSFTLSGKDREALAAKLRRHGGDLHAVVGFYRSHTRRGLYLDQDDFSIIDAHFAHPSQVFLLVKTSPAGLTAGLFFWEEGEMRRQASYLEFPFEHGKLLAGGYPVCRRSEQWAPAERHEEAAPGGRALPVRLGIAAMIAVIAAIPAGMVAWRRSVAQHAHGRLSLGVERSGEAMRLTWDRTSPAVREAKGGFVLIRDDAGEYRLDLPPHQLAAGSILYFPTGRDVSFEVEIYGEGGRSSEIVRAVAPPAGGRPAPLPAPLLLPPEPLPAPVMQASVPRPPTAAVAHRDAGPAHAAPARPFEYRPRVARAAPVRELAPPPNLQFAPPSARIVPPPGFGLHREARVTFGPASPAGSPLRKIPALLHIQASANKGFVPARAVRQVRPALPASMFAGSSEMTAVEVKLRVDQSGNVAAADLLASNAPPLLAKLVLGAAREWHFAPALLNGKAVASQTVQRFRFEP